MAGRTDVLARPVLAITAQQSFGIVVALLVTAGWILYLVANIKNCLLYTSDAADE